MRLPQHHVAAIKYDLNQIEQNLLPYGCFGLAAVAKYMDQLEESVALLRTSLNASAEESREHAE